MLIRQGNPKSLAKVKGRAKVWKKTNQWYYCPSCMVLYFFRVFKCRFDFDAPIWCDGCDGELLRAPESICGEAKKIFPHFKRKRHQPQNGAEWYYDVYLKSDLWKTIRERILDRDNRTCVRCQEPACIVHHKSYDQDVLAGNRDDMLVSLCFDCHRFIEFDGDKKLTLSEANARL